jgi:hypothetical protein
MAKTKIRACKDFRASPEDPTFCANCGDFASMHKGPTPGATRSFRLAVPIVPSDADKLADELAEKFIGWPLPDSVCSDLCATDTKYKHRTGTNLLSYVEARQMMHEVVIATLRHKGITLTHTPATAR